MFPGLYDFVGVKAMAFLFKVEWRVQLLHDTTQVLYNYFQLIDHSSLLSVVDSYWGRQQNISDN